MSDLDVEGSIAVQIAGFSDLDRREGIEPQPLTDALYERQRTRHRHFLTNDPAGCWVAVDDDRVVGSAIALRRGDLWGLSLLVVDPGTQSAGLGRRLLDASLTYAEPGDRAIILSSQDPRAMRLYATSGFDLHPQVQALGDPDRGALPALRRAVREGSVADAAWADAVDLAVRGAPRGPDHLRMAADLTMFVVDDVAGRGYAYVRGDGIVVAVSATDDDTARTLLWRGLAHAADTEVPADLEFVNAYQQWAISIAYLARLKVTPTGPLMWRGGTPPHPYLPSGAYL
jgi:GNAT superfamily N-acetyltransferase